MVVGKEVNLPEYSELTVPEVNLSTATLMSAAPYLGMACEDVNNEFMLCRFENSQDPRKCVSLGKEVTKCALEFFRNIKSECLTEFNQYANCIDKSSGNYQMKFCRKTQRVFDYCMKDKFCMDRPHFGYFCRGRIHDSNTPPPPKEPCPCHPIITDPTPSLPDCKSKTSPRFGSRLYWITE